MTPDHLLNMDTESAWDTIDQLVDVDPLALRDLALALLSDLRAAKQGEVSP